MDKAGLDPWQLMSIGGVLIIVIIITIVIVVREILYAVHPDKRPVKKKRRE